MLMFFLDMIFCCCNIEQLKLFSGPFGPQSGQMQYLNFKYVSFVTKICFLNPEFQRTVPMKTTLDHIHFLSSPLKLLNNTMIKNIYKDNILIIILIININNNKNHMNKDITNIIYV